MIDQPTSLCSNPKSGAAIGGLPAAIYRPSRWGEIYHGTTCHEVLGAGAAGPGKSWVLLMDPIQQVIIEHKRCLDRHHMYPLDWGSSTGWALHLRRTRPMLEQTIVRSQRVFPRIDPKVRWDAQHTTWIFSSGYRYQFGHCKDSGDWDIYMSNEYTHLAFDELVQFEEEQYDQIKTRVRSGDPVLSTMLKVRAMSNPLMKPEVGDNFTVKDPYWVRKYFVEPNPDGGEILRKVIRMSDGSIKYRDRLFLRATLYDNPNPEFVKQYEESLQDSKPHIRQALLFGNWWVTAGAYYADEWNPTLHICEPFKIPEDWPMFRSMDWGFKLPGCVHWYAMSPEDTLYVFREMTFQGKTDEEVAKAIKETEQAMKVWKLGEIASPLTGPADTQLWEERGKMGKSMAHVMLELGVHWMQADKRSRQANAQKLSKRLRDHGSGTLVPGIVFFKSCKKIIETLPGINSDPHQSECPMDGGPDHWHDSICYGVAYASRPVPARKQEKDPHWDNDLPPVENRGRHGYGADI